MGSDASDAFGLKVKFLARLGKLGNLGGKFWKDYNESLSYMQ